MANIEGTNNNDNLNGNANQSDTVFGGRGNDKLSGQSGNDYLNGGRGNDLLIGGSGSDILTGGLDADTFQWSAGHIAQGVVDWITDFSFNQGDTLNFLASASGSIEIVSAKADFVDNTAFNGFDLSNSANGRELVLEIRNTGNGAVQKIVLIDSYSAANNAQWEAYLATFGYTGGIAADLNHVTL